MKSKKGFTLVEVITVIVILSILLVLLLPSITKVAYNSKISLDNSKRTSIEVAAEKYGNADINEFQKCTGTVNWNDTYCSIDPEALYETGYLEDEDSLINPITNKNYDGRVVFCYNNENINIEAKYLTEGQSFTCGGDLIGDGDLTPIDPVEKNVTVSLEPNGGILLGITPINRKTGQIYGDLGVATKDGYTFDGWYTTSTGGTKIVPNTLVTNKENHTLYAHYSTNKYTVTYDANGGSCDVTSQNYSYNESLKVIPTPTRSGYTFDGWYTEDSGGTKVTTPYTVTSNITLYAHWTKEIVYYTLTFKDGSTTYMTRQVESGTTTNNFPTLTKAGYNFDGWYTTNSGGTKKTSITVTSNITLYAHWSSNNVLMARNANEKIWLHSENIKKIVFESRIQSKTNVSYSYDLSANGDNSIVSYLVRDTTDNTKYIAYIQANGKIFANSTSSSYFSNFTSLELIEGLSILDTSNVEWMTSMFYNCNKLTSLDLTSFNTSKVRNMFNMFGYCRSLTSLNLSNFNTSNVTDMGQMFYGCNALNYLNISSFNTSNVTSMHYMFRSCSNLTSLNISNFNTGKVSDMAGMFALCSKIMSLNLSNFNTSNVYRMEQMFDGCSSLTSLNVSSFDTSGIGQTESMFEGCKNLTYLNLSNFNTKNVSSMRWMFKNCSSLTSLNLNNFDTSKANNMTGMFEGCTNLMTIDLSSFITKNVTDMTQMFKNCNSLTSLNLSSFNTSKVTDVNHMFENCSKLSNLDLRNFNYSSITSSTSNIGIFSNISNTVKIRVSNNNAKTWFLKSTPTNVTASNFTIG